MTLKDRIDEEFIRVARRQQAIRSFIRPIDRQPSREGDKPVLKWVVLVRSHEAIAHAREGNVVHPCRMRLEVLRRARGVPFRQSFVVLLRGIDLPAHKKEHDVEHGDLFRQRRNVRECAQDIREYFGSRMRIHALLRVQQ